MMVYGLGFGVGSRVFRFFEGMKDGKERFKLLYS